MKKLVMLGLCFASSWAAAGPIYSCNVGGKTVFQQNPCTADKLESLAPTYTSEVYKREEIERRQIAEAEAQRAREWEEARAQKARSDFEKNIAEAKEKKLADDAKVQLVKECLSSSNKCEIEPLRFYILGLTQYQAESALGQGRMQRIGDSVFHYYPVETAEGKYTLQIIYKYKTMPSERGMSTEYVATEVNY